MTAKLKTTRPSATIRAEISQAGQAAFFRYQTHAGTRLEVEALRTTALGSPQSVTSQLVDTYDPGGFRHYVGYRKNDVLALLAAEGYLRVLESDPDTAAALKILTPLFEELAEAEAAERAAHQEAQKLEDDRTAAKARAKAEAIAEIEARFSEPSPTNEPPPAPFRGKGIKLAVSS
jgi:hypothetical protein